MSNTDPISCPHCGFDHPPGTNCPAFLPGSSTNSPPPATLVPLEVITAPGTGGITPDQIMEPGSHKPVSKEEFSDLAKSIFGPKCTCQAGSTRNYLCPVHGEEIMARDEAAKAACLPPTPPPVNTVAVAEIKSDEWVTAIVVGVRMKFNRPVNEEAAFVELAAISGALKRTSMPMYAGAPLSSVDFAIGKPMPASDIKVDPKAEKGMWVETYIAQHMAGQETAR